MGVSEVYYYDAKFRKFPSRQIRQGETRAEATGENDEKPRQKQLPGMENWEKDDQSWDRGRGQPQLAPHEFAWFFCFRFF